MARRNNEQQAQPAVEGEVAAVTTEVAAAEEQAAEDEQQAQPAVEGDEPQDPEPPVEPGETIAALVLHDSVYGKCGEVKDFPADQADAIAAAGYIDTHPNAVKSAEG